jgi:hypothetical protein
MESTGVYWQPVFNLLEGHFQAWVVNAQLSSSVGERKLMKTLRGEVNVCD